VVVGIEARNMVGGGKERGGANGGKEIWIKC